MAEPWFMRRDGAIRSWPSYRAFLLGETCWAALVKGAAA